jgi:hypothetical protein
MNTYKCCVQVAGPNSKSMLVVWTRVNADNSNAARLLLEAQYGRGNVIGVPTVVK